MSTVPTFSGKTGKTTFSVSCAYHGDLGRTDTEDEADKLATDHLQTAHADATKTIAPSAEVLIQVVCHFTAVDIVVPPPV